MSVDIHQKNEAALKRAEKEAERKRKQEEREAARKEREELETQAAANRRPRGSGVSKRVWEICNANADKTFREIIDLCLAEGINSNTAQGQYVLWKRQHDAEK